jgi:hypothetical protein
MALRIGVCAAQPPTRCPFGHEQTYGQNWNDVRLTPERVGGTASTPTACCYKRWDLLTNQCPDAFQTTGYPPLPTVRAMLSMQGALSSVR